MHLYPFKQRRKDNDYTMANGKYYPKHEYYPYGIGNGVSVEYLCLQYGWYKSVNSYRYRGRHRHSNT